MTVTIVAGYLAGSRYASREGRKGRSIHQGLRMPSGECCSAGRVSSIHFR